MTLPAPIRSKVEESFARQSLMTTLGARIVSLAPGRCSISAPVGGNALQQHGAAHAGVTFALGDSAAGYAALTVLPDDTEVMTAEMKINLLRPATGDRLLAEGEVAKAGSRLVVVRATVWAEADGTRREVALLQGTMVPVAI